MKGGLYLWIGRVSLAALGYIGAVIAAVAVTVAILFMISIYRESGSAPALARYTRQIPETFTIGFVITVQAAAPGFLCALALAVSRRWRTWRPYVVMGGLNAPVSLAFLNLFMGSFVLNMPASLLVPCIFGGLAGGLAFWRVAANNVADWRGASV